MNKNYETELPEGYEQIYEIDAKSKRFTIIANLIGILFLVAGILLCVLIYRPAFEDILSWRYWAAIGIALVYIVLHELTHGAAYKLLTHRKLTFGLTATVAFCGVPDIYVYRKASLIAVLAPFVVFDIVFLAGACLLPDSMMQFFSAILLVIHISGCVGDLYNAYLYLTRFRDPVILTKDTGPVQTFYTKVVK